MQNFLHKLTGHLPVRSVNALKNLLPTERCVLCSTAEQHVICSQCSASFTTHSDYCHGCGVMLGDTHLNYCGSCLENPFEFDRVYVLYTYTPIVKELVHRFKYTKNLSIGKYFAKELAQYYTQQELDYDVIIPIPLHPRRIRKRGFNQAIELMRYLPHTIPSAVSRVKYTKELNTLSPQKRIKEIKGAFAVGALNASKILIVDDVLTTATSTNELSKMIRKYYKKHKLPSPNIDVLVLARALLDN